MRSRSSRPRSPGSRRAISTSVYPLASGSEAVEAALKLARQYWVEMRAAARSTRSWRSLPPITATRCSRSRASAREHYQAYFREWLVEIVRVPAPYPYRVRVRGAAPLCPACSGEAIEATIFSEEARTRSRRSLPSRSAAPRAGRRFRTPDYWPRVREIVRPPRYPAGRRRDSDRARAGPAPGRRWSRMESCRTS